MENRNRQFIQLGIRNKSLSRLKNSKNSESQSILFTQKPLIPIQNNLDSKKVKFYEKNNNILYQNHQPNVQSLSSMNNSKVLQNRSINGTAFSYQKVQIQNKYSNYHSKISPSSQGIHILSRECSPKNQNNSRSKLINYYGYKDKYFQKSESNLNLIANKRQSLQQFEAPFIQKIKILEQAICQKQRQKNHIQTTLLTQKNQNIKLKRELQILYQKQVRISQLEEMLQKQISKSLQLMDINQKLQQQVNDYRTDLFVKDTLLNSLEQQIRKLKGQLYLKNGQNDQMKINVKKFEQDLKNYIQLINSAKYQAEVQRNTNQLIILELNRKVQQVNNQNKTLNSCLNKKQSQIIELQKGFKLKLQLLEQSKELKFNQLNQIIQKYKLKIYQIQGQLYKQKTNARNFSVTDHNQNQFDKYQCKKCKQLLQTVFKLNSYLNKK